MVRAPVLALPNATDPFILDTDASDKSVGAELIGQLPLWLLKIHQPGQTVMVCPDREMPPQQIIPKLSREPNNC
jgi:hypothetical protein